MLQSNGEVVACVCPSSKLIVTAGTSSVCNCYLIYVFPCYMGHLLHKHFCWSLSSHISNFETPFKRLLLCFTSSFFTFFFMELLHVHMFSFLISHKYCLFFCSTLTFIVTWTASNHCCLWSSPALLFIVNIPFIFQVTDDFSWQFASYIGCIWFFLFERYCIALDGLQLCILTLAYYASSSNRISSIKVHLAEPYCILISYSRAAFMTQDSIPVWISEALIQFLLLCWWSVVCIVVVLFVHTSSN